MLATNDEVPCLGLGLMGEGTMPDKNFMLTEGRR